MAYSTKLCLPLQRPCFVPKTGRSNTLMLQQSEVQQVKVKQVTVSQPQPIRYSTKNTVFEDPKQGIICYTDDNGEVICEGYDEGPRCTPIETPTVASYPREVEILDLLQRNYQELSGAKNDGQKQIIASQQELMMIKWSSFELL